MTTTAQTIINGSLRLLGRLAEGETASSETSADCLEILNDLLESMDLERLMIYQVLEEAFPLTSGTGSYTIGSGGVFNTVRPAKVEESTFFRDTRITPNVDYPLAIIDNNAYDGISIKTLQSTYPQVLFYDPVFPLATIYIWPVPNVSGLTLYLNSTKQLQTFPLLTTAVSLPLGYNRLLRYNLAPEIAAEFGVDCPADVARVAAKSKRNVQRINQQQNIMSFPDALTVRRGRFNIYLGS